MARSTVSIRLSGQPFAKASSISGSSLRCSRDHAADDVAEECGLGRQILLALDLAADPVAFEFGQDLVQRRRREIHLIERLHRGEPRRAALVGACAVLGSMGRRLAMPLSFGALTFELDQGERGARGVAALVALREPSARPACASLSTVRMPLPTGN